MSIRLTDRACEMLKRDTTKRLSEEIAGVVLHGAPVTAIYDQAARDRNQLAAECEINAADMALRLASSHVNHFGMFTRDAGGMNGKMRDEAALLKRRLMMLVMDLESIVGEAGRDVRLPMAAE